MPTVGQLPPPSVNQPVNLPRITYPTALVLYAVSDGWAYGFDIIDATGLGSGTVYPILRRLESAGLLKGSHEPIERAHDAGRPPRRYYTLTAHGATALRAALQKHLGVVAHLGARRGGVGGTGGAGGTPVPAR